MSIPNFRALLQELLPTKDLDDALKHLLVSVSAQGDCLALAAAENIVVLQSKYAQDKRYFQPVLKDSMQTTVSALLLLPVMNNRRSVSQGMDSWNALVIGYSDGHVDFRTLPTGQLLVRKRFSDRAIVRLRCNASPANNDFFKSATVAKLDELMIIDEATVSCVQASELYQLLNANLQHLTKAKASGGDIAEQLSKLPCKKFIVRDQKVSDVCSFTVPNVTFDQLRHLSMSARMNEDHLRSLGQVSTYITVGDAPFLQYNVPHSLVPQNINELAQNVVSTVKSGIFRVASGFIWGGAGEQNQEEVKDPEQKMHVLHALKDRTKEGTEIEKSPDGQYAVIVDNQKRVLLLNNYLGTIMHMWKGYHHVQVAWCITSWDKHSPESNIPDDLQIANLLVLYLPRRGLIEIWSPEQKHRVAEFEVSKAGRLISAANAVLDPMSKVPAFRNFHCAFLDATTGKIHRIYVPVHVLKDRSSSSYDQTLENKLHHILHDETIDFNEQFDEIADIVSKAKTPATKYEMLLKLLVKRVSASNTLRLVTIIEGQLGGNADTLLGHLCTTVKAFVELTELLRTEVDEETGEVKEALGCSETEMGSFKDVRGLMNLDSTTRSIEGFQKQMTFAEAVSCLELKGDLDEELTFKKKYENLGFMKFVFHLSRSHDNESVFEILQNCKLSGQTLMRAFFDALLLTNDSGFLAFLPYSVPFLNLCMKLHLDSGESRQSWMQIARKFFYQLKAGPKAFLTIFVWKRYIAQDKHLATYLDEWERILLVFEGYVNLWHSFLEVQSEQRDLLVTTVDGTFNSGNGRIVEIVSKWLADEKFDITDLVDDEYDCADEKEKTPVRKFIDVCSQFFPKSFQREVLICHVAWENMHRFNLDHKQTDRLEAAVDALRMLDHSGFQLGFCSLAWTASLNQICRSVVNVTENRSAVRCERELGLKEAALPVLVNLLWKTMKLWIGALAMGAEKVDQEYDDVSVITKLNLLDHIKKIPPPDYDVITLQFQYVTTALYIWQFRIEVKPLSLFNHQESNQFFQNSSARGFFLFSGDHNRTVKKSRRDFLEVAAEEVTGCLHYRPTETGDPILEMSVFQEWSTRLSELAKLWYLPDRVRLYQAVSLYRNGYDSLGEEFLLTVPDKEASGKSLLEIAMLRLSRYIYDASDHDSKISMVKPEILSKLTAMQSKANELPLVTDLKQTSDLLILVCNLDDIAEDLRQLGYECLAIVQTFRRMEG